MQLQTTCHTHELLGCNCLNEDDHEDEEDGSTNGDASGAEDEDEDDRPAGFQSASLIRPETTAKVDKAVSVGFDVQQCGTDVGDQSLQRRGRHNLLLSGS